MSHQNGNTSSNSSKETERKDNRYPLIDQQETLQSASGRTLDQVTLEQIAAGNLNPADLQVSADTLRAQASIAADAGYDELSQNLLRAAELTAVPNSDLLRMYEQLRPGRSSYDALNALADELESNYDAKVTAAFVREAADVYRRRNLLRRS